MYSHFVYLHLLLRFSNKSPFNNKSLSLKPVFSGLVAASSQALTKATDTGAQQFCGSGQEFIHLDMDLKC